MLKSANKKWEKFVNLGYICALRDNEFDARGSIKFYFKRAFTRSVDVVYLYTTSTEDGKKICHALISRQTGMADPCQCAEIHCTSHLELVQTLKGQGMEFFSTLPKIMQESIWQILHDYTEMQG